MVGVNYELQMKPRKVCNSRWNSFDIDRLSIPIKYWSKGSRTSSHFSDFPFSPMWLNTGPNKI